MLARDLLYKFSPSCDFNDIKIENDRYGKHTHTRSTHACTHAHTRTHARAHTHTHTQTDTHTHTHTETNTHTHTDTHTHTHTQTHTHTHAHTDTQTNKTRHSDIQGNTEPVAGACLSNASPEVAVTWGELRARATRSS